MFDTLKKRFPGLYDFYQHTQRMKILKKIKKMENVPEDKYAELIENEYLKVLGHSLNWDNLPNLYRKNAMGKNI